MNLKGEYTVYYPKSVTVDMSAEPRAVRRGDYNEMVRFEAEGLEEVFRRMNIVDGDPEVELPIKLKCRSMMVGDLVIAPDNTAWYCAPAGWLQVTFTAEPKDFRLVMIKLGLEVEMRGFRLTAKAPRCFKIIADEFGIKAKRSAAGKRAAYEQFCKEFGFVAKPVTS